MQDHGFSMVSTYHHVIRWWSMLLGKLKEKIRHDTKDGS